MCGRHYTDVKALKCAKIARVYCTGLSAELVEHTQPVRAAVGRSLSSPARPWVASEATRGCGYRRCDLGPSRRPSLWAAAQAAAGRRTRGWSRRPSGRPPPAVRGRRQPGPGPRSRAVSRRRRRTGSRSKTASRDRCFRFPKAG